MVDQTIAKIRESATTQSGEELECSTKSNLPSRSPGDALSEVAREREELQGRLGSPRGSDGPSLSKGSPILEIFPLVADYHRKHPEDSQILLRHAREYVEQICIFGGARANQQSNLLKSENSTPNQSSPPAASLLVTPSISLPQPPPSSDSHQPRVFKRLEEFLANFFQDDKGTTCSFMMNPEEYKILRSIFLRKYKKWIFTR